MGLSSTDKSTRAHSHWRDEEDWAQGEHRAHLTPSSLASGGRCIHGRTSPACVAQNFVAIQPPMDGYWNQDQPARQYHWWGQVTWLPPECVWGRRLCNSRVPQGILSTMDLSGLSFSPGFFLLHGIECFLYSPGRTWVGSSSWFPKWPCWWLRCMHRAPLVLGSTGSKAIWVIGVGGERATAKTQSLVCYCGEDAGRYIGLVQLYYQHPLFDLWLEFSDLLLLPSLSKQVGFGTKGSKTFKCGFFSMISLTDCTPPILWKSIRVWEMDQTTLEVHFEVNMILKFEGKTYF